MRCCRLRQLPRGFSHLDSRIASCDVGDIADPQSVESGCWEENACVMNLGKL